MKNVLIIEDDPDILELLQIHLRDLECSTKIAMDGNTGLQVAMDEVFDLIILDLMLPKMDGLEVCRQLRAKNIATPILMLTARSEEIDKVLGLETGADDYLTKPFSVREFIARVKAMFRRVKMIKETGVDQPEKILKKYDLVIERAKRKVTLAGQRLDLTPKEFDLLALLAANPGHSYTRKRLLRVVWGYDFEGYEHTVNSHINRLRAKIEPDPNQPLYILTTWGVGYRFTDE
jgi:DNA-binding response OmpR family regulator